MKKIIGTIVWLLTAIGAINWGLTAMGWGLFQFKLFMVTMPWLIKPTMYVVGLAGVLSVVMFFTGMFKDCESC